MAVTTATVTGTFPAGTTASTVKFTPSVPVNLPGAPELLGATAVAAKVVSGSLLASDGTSALTLPVTGQGTPLGATGFWYWQASNLPGIPDFGFFLAGDSDLTALVGSGAAGNLQLPVTTQAADYTVTSTDATVLLDGAALTATLPDATTVTGRAYTVKLTAAGATATVAAGAGQVIDGAASYALTAQYKSVTVQSDGANWQVLAVA